MTIDKIMTDCLTLMRLLYPQAVITCEPRAFEIGGVEVGVDNGETTADGDPKLTVGPFEADTLEGALKELRLDLIELASVQRDELQGALVDAAKPTL